MRRAEKQPKTGTHALRGYDFWVVTPHFRNNAIPDEEAPIEDILLVMFEYTEAIIEYPRIASVRLVVRQVPHPLKRFWRSLSRRSNSAVMAGGFR